ncbi:MAG: type I-C CRISPR-associated protein Cas8c/Csd1 [Methylomonas lenta]|nr:type I-C CRISPR-associated protein Cas8c/Csd1 [Methylomonas lenta]
MSWMEKLYQTYEAGMQLDLPLEQRLMPISHTPQNAHINIILDGEGNFLSGSVLEKTQIILPATEDSASRGNIEASHALADKLQYVAKDYAAFGGQKKAYFCSYEEQLQKWCDSEYGHEKVKAVLCYVQKGTVIQDLVNLKILHVNADNKLLTTWEGQQGEQPLLFKVLPKEKGSLDQGSALVCWTVEKGQSDPVTQTWKDETIQKSWIAYDTTNGGEKGLCYITGQQQPLSTKHPAKIRHSGDKAKLISANDTSGYTYRGKFLADNQACGIGFEVSQKAHNALGWLIQRQGFRNGDQAYVAWAVSGKDIPAPLVDAYSVMDEEPKEIDLGTNLAQDYAIRLRNYMAGYAAKLKSNEQIIIMGIDSATPGRMGIIYYRELFSHEFLSRLETWHSQFAWPQRHTKEITNTTGKKLKTKVIWPISSPVPMAIAKAAYGENVTDNLKKKVIERLMPCIIDGQPFPIDLVMSCVRKATNRVGYASDAQWLWEKNLGIACALYKGYHQRSPNLTQRREYAMALEENYHARDYLFGRLLAIAERIEDVALNVSGENRPTTAARLMQRFADRPFETWRTIELGLQPYMQRLRVSRAGFLTNQLKELDSVQAMFKHDDFTSKAALSGEFLLGYHCQRQKLRIKSETTDETSQGDSE